MPDRPAGSYVEGYLTRPSLLRALLYEVRQQAGREAFLRLAVRYGVEDAGSDDEIEDAIVGVVDDDFDQVVLEAGPWGLPIWAAIVESRGGTAPLSAEHAITVLSTLLEAPKTIGVADENEAITTIETGCLDEDDDEPTGYPGREDLSTDAVLPWVRTKLTNFQRRAARAAFEALYKDNDQNTLLCLPEAGGRTRTAADIVLGACVARGMRAIWVRSSRVLLDQVQEEIRELGWLVGELGSRRSVFSISRLGSQHCDVSADLVLMTPGALARTGIGLEDIEQHGEVSLICIDDAFMVADTKVRGVLDAIFRAHVRVLGLTGTPMQSVDPDVAMMREVFTEGQSFQLGFRDLVEAHHLARPVFIRKRLGSTKALPISATEVQWCVRGRRDFSGSLLRTMIRLPGRNREILGHWLDHRSRYGPTIVFAYDEEHATAMAAWLTDRGVPNDPIHPGMDPAVRRQRLERFRRKQSEVLVLSGLLTEGEHTADVQTVVLARPTLSPVLYKHMVGHGARRPQPIVGKSLFYVVDCIDDLEEYGVSLAGRSAAIELDADFEDTTTVLVPTEMVDQRKRRHRALISARAWQILRRFADDQYSVWGELIWALPSGGEKSVIVFHEGVARLRTAVDLVEAAIAKNDLVPLREMGLELDWLGAVRDVDWQELLGDCAETGEPPQLSRVDDAAIPPTVEACARILAQLVEEMLSGRMTIHVAMDHCDSLLADSEPLQDQFHSVIELRQELLKLYHDAVARVEIATVSGTGDRRELVDAFVRLTVGVAMADKVLHESESRAIVKAVSRMFELTTEEQQQWVVDAVEQFRGEALDTAQTADVLKRHATPAERYHMYDWLFRVAFADGVFVREERELLHDAAAALGIPADEVEELESRYVATLPKGSVPPPNGDAPPPSLMPAPRLRYCTQCGYPRQLGADFCVSCGTELPATAPLDLGY